MGDRPAQTSSAWAAGTDNVPGQAGGNWRRALPAHFDPKLGEALRKLAEFGGRLADDSLSG